MTVFLCSVVHRKLFVHTPYYYTVNVGYKSLLLLF